MTEPAEIVYGLQLLACSGAYPSGARAAASALVEQIERGERVELGVAAIDPATFLGEDMSERRATGTLTVMIEVLVFVPVALTWFHLSKALEAYAQEDGAASGEPFLALWQGGFGGSVTPLSEVATWVVLALGAIGLLALLRGVLNARARNAEHAVRRWYISQMNEARVLVLSLPAEGDDDDGAGALTEAGVRSAVRDLKVTVDGAGHAASRLGATGSVLAAAVDQLGERTDALTAAATAIMGHASSVDAAIAGSATSVERANQQITDLSTAARDLITEAAAVSRQMERAQASTTAMAGNVGLIATRTDEMATTVRGGLRAVEATFDGLNNELVVLRRLVRDLELIRGWIEHVASTGDPAQEDPT